MSDDIYSCPKDCYWISQGQCFLEKTPEEYVVDIMLKTPQARADASRCRDLGCCTIVSERVLHIVLNDIKIQTQEERFRLAEERQNKFTDRTKFIGPGVFKDPTQED